MSTPAQSAAIEERMAAVRVSLRPVGHPLPLGFLGLGVATILVSGLQLEWFPPAEGSVVALALIAFVFPVQLVSAVFGYLGRDAVAGTAMGILAGTWLTVGVVQRDLPPGGTSKALGLFLFMTATAIALPAIAAATAKLVPAIVLALTSLRFLFTGLYQWTGSSNWKSIAGAEGVVLGTLAIYAALAIILEDATGSMILPLGKHGKGLLASIGSLPDQVADVEHEPGVRQQL
jgi:succinate-acetate transporter protein